MYEPDDTTHQHTCEPITVPARTDEVGVVRGYVRFAALGDSATSGLCDRAPGGWRGWATILTDSLRESHDLSFCNLAVPGATTTDVAEAQLAEAVAHRPHLSSLIVGLNDTMRSTWDVEQVRENLFRCADELTTAGSMLLTVRFHDHSRVLPLPKLLARPMSQRIADLNDIYDEIHQHHGSLRVDLSKLPEVYDRRFWSVDRLHPSELGHRFIANAFAGLCNDAGLPFGLPSLACDNNTPTRQEDLRWLLQEGVPWAGRRIRDLAPAMVTRLRQRRLIGAMELRIQS